MRGCGTELRRAAPLFLIEFVTEIFTFCFDFFRPVSSIIIVNKKKDPEARHHHGGKESQEKENAASGGSGAAGGHDDGADHRGAPWRGGGFAAGISRGAGG